MLTALAVIARIVTNPVSNLFQKQLAQRSANPLFIIAATHGLLTTIALPFLLAEPLGALDAVFFWANMLTAVLLAVAGNVMLVYALRSTDLSILGPINAYKAVLSLVLAVVLIGEVPTLFGLVGVMLIVVGSYFVIDRVPGQPRSSAFRQFIREPGVRLRFAALICSATEAVFLKRALLCRRRSRRSSCGRSSVSLSPQLPPFLLRSEIAAEMKRLTREWRTYLWLGVTTGLMQVMTLLTFGRLQVG